MNYTISLNQNISFQDPDLNSFLNRIKDTNNENLKEEYYLNDSLKDKLTAWLSTNPSDFSLKGKTFQVLFCSAVYRGIASLEKVIALYKKNYPLSEQESINNILSDAGCINDVVIECLCAPHTEKQKFITNLLAAMTTAQVEELLKNSIFLYRLLFHPEEFRDSIIDTLIMLHNRTFREALSSHTEERSFLYRVIDGNRHDSLFKKLISDSRVKTTIYDYLVKDSKLTNLELLGKLPFLIFDMPIESLKEFLSKTDLYGKYYLYVCLKDEKSRKALICRLPDLKDFLIEKKFWQYYLENREVNHDLVLEFFIEFPELLQSLSNYDQLSLSSYVSSITSIDLKKCVASLSTKELEKFLVTHPQIHDQEEKAKLIIQTLAKRGSLIPLLHLTQRNIDTPLGAKGIDYRLGLLKVCESDFDQLYTNPNNVSAILGIVYNVSEFFQSLSKENQKVFSHSTASALFPTYKSEELEALTTSLHNHFLMWPTAYFLVYVLQGRWSAANYLAHFHIGSQLTQNDIRRVTGWIKQLLDLDSSMQVSSPMDFCKFLGHLESFLEFDIDTLPNLKDFFNSFEPEVQKSFARSIALALFPKHAFQNEELELLTESLIEHMQEFSAFYRLAEVLNGFYSLTHYLASRSEWAFPEILHLTDRIFEIFPNEPIGIHSLTRCMEMQNSQMFEKFLQHVDTTFIQNHSLALLKSLANTRSLEQAELLFSKGLDLQKVLEIEKTDSSDSQKSSLITNLIGWNNWKIVKWLFDQGLKISPEDGEELLLKALTTGNAEMIKHIADQRDKQYPDILGFDRESPENRKEKLEFYAAFTSFSFLKNLIDSHYPHLKADLESIRPLLAVMVRFPSQSEWGQVFQKIPDVETYVKQSFDYARKNREFIEKAAKNLNPSWRGLLQEIIEERCVQNCHLLPEYKEIRIDQTVLKNYTATPLSQVESKFEDNTTSLNEPRVRYYNAWNQGNEYRRHRSCVDSSFKSKKNQVNFFYTLPSEEKVCITRLYLEKQRASLRFLSITYPKIYWEHARPADIQKCEPHLDQLHHQVTTFKLTEENKAEFFQLVARTYWLIATLCETRRGTPHNAMMWLNIIYEHHKLPPPIPKLEHFFLDNTMLMITWEETIALWDTFFES